ncbi:hypothetical protein BJ742DRAFT_736170 [Cladochytrium replicatum]|nr:hypothetical protein BJ742DRAFT_736170 [Cladochytrium replicatum]
MRGEPEVLFLNLSLRLHGEKFMAPSGGATLILNQNEERGSFTAIDAATNETFFELQKGITTLEKFTDPATKQTICKLDAQAFGPKKTVVDAQKKPMYQIHEEVMEDKPAFRTVVKNSLDGLEYDVILRIWLAHGELFSIINGERRLVAVTERLHDAALNKFTYNLKIAEGLDIVLVVALLVASRGGGSKLTQVGAVFIGSMFFAS